MPRLNSPTITHITTTTQQGEVTININLTLAIKDGELQVSTKTEEDKIPDYIPDWEPVRQDDLLDFGKDVK